MSFLGSLHADYMKMNRQIISSIDGPSEILAQIQEIVIPIIVFTFENRLLGQLIFFYGVDLRLKLPHRRSLR